ncbi:class II aldolase/adducin family protein [Fervidicoccus fontis]|jgi:L-fuculose-phosphate aldolase|uniref:Class II aldolase/adducin, N-terminal n=2 Tax=Fervidicoccus fontis TaxID=683846 RepID=I0A0N1_FERFK|nr:class II aldolase/adducin family protein [Fervidicoccus fontis]AFH42538.1 Class II aldolase/adducin, N-terminal [Fervidicoccus fontis Kam940]MBE9391149.1 class II aldolase/adducin family protein [Fervidicoccus fontis]PMB75757.1 MAG: aldolase [Fervidicoccus fontis]PMB78143.1 MAG: aldolase [Fervidicoccus fontis]HEW64051.1 class II aldolase/adducin family protein [Fervidicoccus fontis]
MYDDLKKKVVEVMKFMEQHELNYGRSGNVSIRIQDTGHILITPTGVKKSALAEDDIAVVDLSGKTIEGKRKPSVEMPLHLAIYKNYDYINAVIHAHGIYSTALAVAREPLPPLVEEMVSLTGGDVKVAEYAPSGTDELAENAVKALHERKAVLLANHGIVACGETIDEALEILVLVERISKVYILSKVAGVPKVLPFESLEKQVQDFRKRIKRNSA